MMLRLLESVASCLDRESARRLVKLRVDPAVTQYFHDLARKDEQGTLTEGERTELMMFLHAGNFIEVLQRQARAILRRHAGEAERSRRS